MVIETGNFRAIESIGKRLTLGQSEYWPKHHIGNFHGNGNSINLKTGLIDDCMQLHRQLR